MADLTVLIRLHKHELDEKRQALGKLYAAQAELELARRDLERAYLEEKAAVDASGDVHFTFQSYAEKIRRQQAEIISQENELAAQIEVAKDSMMQTFSELKKYEMTQEERERLAAEERKIREGKAMDDIGLENFRRKDGD